MTPTLRQVALGLSQGPQVVEPLNSDLVFFLLLADSHLPLGRIHLFRLVSLICPGFKR